MGWGLQSSTLAQEGGARVKERNTVARRIGFSSKTCWKEMLTSLRAGISLCRGQDQGETRSTVRIIINLVSCRLSFHPLQPLP